MNYERPVHQNGSCFVWKWWSGKNQNIIMFPKMGVFKTDKLGKIKNIQVFEILCLHRPEASPNNWKHRNGKDMEIQGPVRREVSTCHHSELFQPPTSISCVLESSF